MIPIVVISREQYCKNVIVAFSRFSENSAKKPQKFVPLHFIILPVSFTNCSIWLKALLHKKIYGLLTIVFYSLFGL